MRTWRVVMDGRVEYLGSQKGAGYEAKRLRGRFPGAKVQVEEETAGGAR